MKRFKPTIIGLWLVCAGLLLPGNLPATDGSASAAMQQTSKDLFSILAEKRSAIEKDSTILHDLVDQILIPHFDFEKITRATVGKHWNKATSTQRQALIQSFQKMLIRTYTKALLRYSGEEIRYLPEKPGPHSTVVVSTEVREPGPPPVMIDYKLYRKGGNWKIYDVTIDAVSLVSNYRGSFDAQIRREGIDALIDRLDEMSAQGQ